jgi:membrane protease YdiL (CAAX protease family)
VPDALSLLAGYGPALAAILVTAAVSGRSGLRALGRRLVLWRVGLQWYTVALLLPAAMMLGGLAVHLLLGGATPSAAHPPTMPLDLPGPLWQQILLLMLIFTLGFDGLGEEVGWRGYALPQLLQRHSALAASLILGALWALWHLPYALTVGSAMSTSPFITQVPGILANAILYTWLFNHTRGSLLLAILFHAANNVTFNALPVLVPGVADIGAWGAIVRWGVVLGVVWYNGPAHLTRTAPTTTTEKPS